MEWVHAGKVSLAEWPPQECGQVRGGEFEPRPGGNGAVELVGTLAAESRLYADRREPVQAAKQATSERCAPL